MHTECDDRAQRTGKLMLPVLAVSRLAPAPMWVTTLAVTAPPSSAGIG